LTIFFLRGEQISVPISVDPSALLRTGSVVLFTFALLLFPLAAAEGRAMLIRGFSFAKMQLSKVQSFCDKLLPQAS